jgi:hypothetical protein
MLTQEGSNLALLREDDAEYHARYMLRFQTDSGARYDRRQLV